MTKILRLGKTIAVLVCVGCPAGNTTAQKGPSTEAISELFFNTQINDGTGKMDKKNWHIKVPSKYVFRLYGSNGDNNPKTGFSANIVFDLHTTSGAVRQLQNGKIDTEWAQVSLYLSNTPVPIAKELKKDICRDTNGETYSNLIRGCKTYNCQIISSYNGWSTEIIVKKELYDQKEKFCEQISKNLDIWTVNVDDLRK
jgi:hypothetical protein